MTDNNAPSKKYTERQSKTISTYFKRQVALFIAELVFLIAGMIILLSKDFLSLKSTKPTLFIIIVASCYAVGLVCAVLRILTYKKMNRYIKKADEENLQEQSKNI